MYVTLIVHSGLLADFHFDSYFQYFDHQIESDRVCVKEKKSLCTQKNLTIEARIQ